MEVTEVLYKKNNTPKLQPELFKDPTSEYRGAPFWSWNCKLEKDMLMRQIEHFKEMGFGGFHMHSRTGLATEYLSDEFMDMVKACCDKAEAERMLAWLYDEDRWSSGPAGGKVTAYKPFRRKRLMLFPEDQGWNTPKAEALESGKSYLLAVYDVMLDTDGYLVGYQRISYGEKATGNIWYAYCVNEKESPWFNYQTYIDAMDKEAVGEFIKVTYERYKETVGDRFDRSVPAIFTDEPNANHEKTMAIPTPEYRDRLVYTWTRFFEEKYAEKYGEDILDKLPELIWNKRDRSDSLTKYRFFDFVSEQFSENYSGQIGKWCADNGIAFTGHYLREPGLEEQSIACGEVMRNYGHMGIPGIDILCNLRELTTAKQTQSAVHQYGKEGMLSELYGVTNWDFDFRGHKLQGDWQAAMGVTVRVPHLAWASMKGEAKRDYPAAIGYQSPWYKEYSYIEDHFARVNTALTRGKPIVKIGVIHPIESCWIMSGPNSQSSSQIAALENNFKNVTDWLLKNHLDFDFICESTLPSLADVNHPDAVGEMHYSAIVVPGCITLRKTTVEYLARFGKHGGRVIFMGSKPAYVDGIKSQLCDDLFHKSICVSFDSSAIQNALQADRCVQILNQAGKNATNLLYNYRQDNDCRWLFIAYGADPGAVGLRKINRQKDVIPSEKISVCVTGEFVPTEYDTLTGEKRPLSYIHKNGNTVITYTLEGYASLLIHLSATEKEQETAPRAYRLLKEYDIKNTVDYTLSEPNVLLLDIAEYAYDDGAWQPQEEILRISRNFRSQLGFKSDQTQPYAVDITPAVHSVRLRFTLQSEIAVSGAFLALEDADRAEITLNGTKVENNITGYFTDESIGTVPLPEIPAGESILTLKFPYGERTNIEWCYLLGDFGVRVMGCEKLLTTRQKRLGFGDITSQTLPFYGANVSYTFEVETEEDGAIEIEASNYRGSLIAVALDGERCGRIVLPPYKLLLDNVKKGKHTVTLTLFGNRHNSFGALHLVNEEEHWFGPNAWRSKDINWCYEYKLRPLGILKSPIIRVYGK